jgi:hypothetical protein
VADPLSDAILENIKAALEAIKIANGYRRDVNRVMFDELNLLEPEPDAILVSPVGIPAVSEPNAMTIATLEVALVCHVYAEENLAKAMLTLSSDIVKALNVDEARGGLASCTEVTNEYHSPYVTSDNHTTGCFGMSLEILYTHVFGDPDTTR